MRDAFELLLREGNPMKGTYRFTVAAVIGAALGALIVQGLHAQAKPKAYMITESEIVDAAAAAAYSPKNQAAQKAAGWSAP